MVSMLALRMRDSDPSQDFGEFSILPWPEKEMPVIGHETIGGNQDARTSMGFGQNLLKGEIVGGFLKQRQSPNPSVQDEIGESVGSQSGAARHGRSSNEAKRCCHESLPIPFY